MAYIHEPFKFGIIAEDSNIVVDWPDEHKTFIPIKIIEESGSTVNLFFQQQPLSHSFIHTNIFWSSQKAVSQCLNALFICFVIWCVYCRALLP